MNADQRVSGKRVFYRFEGIDETVCSSNVEILGTEKFEPEGERPESVEPHKPGFWRRQFGTTVTTKQRRADWIFGVFLPLVCFYFDPIVFRDTFTIDPDHAKGLFSNYQSLVYGFCFVSIMTLAAFLLWGERLKWLNAPVAGTLAASALAAFVIGLILFPFSIVGLIFFIGILGFTPLLTGVVYARNALRATRAAAPYFDKPTLFRIAALTGAATLVIPYIFGR